MSTLTSLPFILFMVVVVTAVAENINVPYPLLLVIAGLILGFIPNMPSWHPPNDMVLALFLPPILFSAARLISWQDVKHKRNVVLALSIGLVLLSTLVIAWLLQLMIPQLSWPAAIILGAIISPTDVVAANSILNKMNVPRSIIRTIKVESLFNDASSIVLYKTGLLLAAGGMLKITEIGHQFFFVGIGGILIGLLFAYIGGIIVKQFLSHSENHLPIIMSLILAYVTYWFAEKLGASGVLATVAAGLYHKKTERSVSASTRIAEKTVWDTLIFFLSGIIFITIGAQFPSYLTKMHYWPIPKIILFSSLTIFVLLALRFIGVTITLLFDPHKVRAPWKRILIVSWSGMRGIVSLALAIALPPLITRDPAFPATDFIVFLTVIVILFTLLVQGLSLPYIIKKIALTKNHEEELKKIRDIYQSLTEQALHHINTTGVHPHTESSVAKEIVEKHYTNRLLDFGHNQQQHAESLLSRMLQFERDLLHKMRERNEISEEIYLKILLKLDRDEVGFSPYK